MNLRSVWLIGLGLTPLAATLGCDVESTEEKSGGVPGLFGGAGGAEATSGGEAGSGMALGGAGNGGAAPKPPPQRTGMLVVNGDYASVSVSILSKGGEVLSPMLISSGSTKPGLSAALSGDVVLPGSDLSGQEAVVIDRSNATITWIGLESGEVRAQLDVGTGFASNPHDYVQVSDTKAYVLRFAGNLASGNENFDEGDDLLVIDPSRPEITGRVDLTTAMAGSSSNLSPAAERGVHIDGKVYAALTGLAADFSSIAPARIVTVDATTDTIEDSLVLDGVTNCTQLVPSPDGSSLAAACNGFFMQDPADGFPDSGIVLLSLDGGLKESARISASAFQHCDSECQNVQVNGLAWVDDDTILASTFGMVSGGENGDVSYPAYAFEVDLTDESAREVASGGAFDIGIPVCFTATCYLPDAGTDGGVLRQFDVGASGALAEGDPIAIDDSSGLPPRHLQRF